MTVNKNDKVNETGALKGAKMYLSLPIEHTNEGDNDWRPEVKHHLTESFGIDVFDPLADEKQKRATVLRAAMEKEDFDQVEEIATAFVKKDLGKIDRSDFLIAYNPKGVPTTGVPCEVHHAVQLKKPVMIVCPDGKRAASLWYWGYIRHEYIFGSWADLYEYLEEVDQFKHRDNHRWWFVYRMV